MKYIIGLVGVALILAALGEAFITTAVVLLTIAAMVGGILWWIRDESDRTE